MPTDITLDDEDGKQVTIQADIVKTVSSDFRLDDPARRSPPNPTQSPFRRALVHDVNDGLTVNYGADYPGGITLHGVGLIIPKDTDKFTPNLVVRGGIEFEVETKQQSGVGHLGGPGPTVPVRRSVDLQEIIDSLQTEVNNLKARVAALEEHH
jgi:hypothetical protein